MNNILHEKPSNPTASVFVDGLGVMCFGDDPNRGEFAFINADGHPLEIYVCDGDRNVIESFPSDKIPSLEGAEITINASENGQSRRYQHPDSKESDDEDFRWMVDVDKIYNTNVEFADKAADSIYAKLYVNNGIYYTKVKSDSNAVLKDAFTLEDKMSLGKVGRVIGADISSDEVEIRIKPKQGEEQTVLLKKGSAPYYIDVRFNCGIPGRTDERSDFYEIYKIVEPPTGETRYSLEHEGIENEWKFARQGNVMSRVACNIVILGGDYRNLP